MNKKTLQRQILTPFVHFSCLLGDDSAGRSARELCWMSKEFSSVNIIIPPSLSMLIYHLGDEQQAHWQLQFRDVVSPHWIVDDDHHQQLRINLYKCE
jgi:hypothetical protein